MTDLTLIERVANWLTKGKYEQMRAWPVGKGEVMPGDEVWGHSNAEFAPAEYGEYLASSNAVYTCATIRADLLASLPVKFFQEGRADKRTDVTGKTEAARLLEYVNPYWNRRRLMRMTSYALDLWGVNFWVLERGENGTGTPKEIWWVRPDRMMVLPHETEYISGFLYYPANGGAPLYFEPGEVVWMPNPNPLDEFSGLSPLAAARLAADYRSAGQKANMKLFEQGYLVGGLLSPKGQTVFTLKQAEELEGAISRRLTGLDKAHKIGVLRFEADIIGNNISPREAMYMEGMNLALEDVARAFRIPLDLIGGQRTYENVDAAMKAVWMLAITPLARFIADELEERYLPLFRNERATEIEFDTSEVGVLQENITEAWERARTQIDTGAITVNEWREEQGMEPVPWGDEPRVSLSPYPGNLAPGQNALTPDPSPKTGEGGEDEPDPDLTPSPSPEGEGRMLRGVRMESMEYGSEGHRRAWERVDRNRERQARRLEPVISGLLMRQMDSILGKLKAPARSVEQSANDPFDMMAWLREFEQAMLGPLVEVTGDAAEREMALLSFVGVFDMERPAVAAAMRRQAQQFAKEVNETTWNAIRDEIANGMQAGEGTTKIEERLRKIFAEWTGSDPSVAGKESRLETIARTEAGRATTTGQIEGARQTGLETRKTWISALAPKRTRDSHAEAHRRYQANPIALDENFEVGNGVGPGPLQMGAAEEDINCQCALGFVVVTGG